jgi:hypothetical protein
MTLDQRNTALRIVALALAPLALAALAASRLWSVEAIGDGAPVRLLGLTPQPCPGCVLCGMSRAFTAVSHGQFGRALEFNPLVFLAYPAAWFVVGAGLFALVHFARRAALAHNFARN